MSVQVSGRRGPQAVAAAREAVERLDGLLSRTDSDSQIARLNTAAGDGAAVAVDPDVAELLAFSQEIARQLPGDFDITIAPVMDAWGFTTEERHVPAPDALAAAMALVDSEELSVDTEASAASLARAGMEVDLGRGQGLCGPGGRGGHPGCGRDLRHAGSGRQRHGHRRQGGRLPLAGGGEGPRTPAATSASSP